MWPDSGPMARGVLYNVVGAPECLWGKRERLEEVSWVRPWVAASPEKLGASGSGPFTQLVLMGLLL